MGLNKRLGQQAKKRRQGQTKSRHDGTAQRHSSCTIPPTVGQWLPFSFLPSFLLSLVLRFRGGEAGRGVTRRLLQTRGSAQNDRLRKIPKTEKRETARSKRKNFVSSKINTTVLISLRSPLYPKYIQLKQTILRELVGHGLKLNEIWTK